MIKKIWVLFKNVGGMQILRQYYHGHVLIYALLISVMLGFSKKSLEILRLAVDNKLLKRLRIKYRKFIQDFKKKNIEINKNQKICLTDTTRKVWICWFQGIENAPEIVRKCYDSVHKQIIDREIVLITENNYQDYVQFPDYIQKKIDAGIISKTHMSDLLRLELLIRYGGTWMDATILCTKKPEKYMLDSDLFFFQNLKPGLDGHCTSISSWFITASKGNIILRLTLEMLYDYWKKHNKLINYFLFHDFFQLSLEAYPDKWQRVIPFSNSIPHILLLRLFQVYDETVWEATKKSSGLHKLTYKFSEIESAKKGTYYEVLFR